MIATTPASLSAAYAKAPSFVSVGLTMPLISDRYRCGSRAATRLTSPTARRLSIRPLVASRTATSWAPRLDTYTFQPSGKTEKQRGVHLTHRDRRVLHVTDKRPAAIRCCIKVLRRLPRHDGMVDLTRHQIYDEKAITPCGRDDQLFPIMVEHGHVRVGVLAQGDALDDRVSYRVDEGDVTRIPVDDNRQRLEIVIRYTFRIRTQPGTPERHTHQRQQDTQSQNTSY